jgi:NADH:ubiquinone oxidoreductase subunit H
MLELLLLSLGVIVPLLIAIAYFTLVERKIMALIQHRQGPIFIGVFGLLQPLADGFKLILKEIIIPSRSNIVLFFLAPIFTFALSVTS